MEVRKIRGTLLPENDNYILQGCYIFPYAVVQGTTEDGDDYTEYCELLFSQTEYTFAEAELKAAKWIGKEYNGSMIGLTTDDAVGMLQVKAAIEMGIESTTMNFDNGTKYVVTAESMAGIGAFFAIERSKFF